MRYVLFVCNHNAGRSQMAQAFWEKHAPSDIRAEYAGSNPAKQVWPEVVDVMSEIGIDLSKRKPKKLLPEMQLHADWAITMGCGDACPYVPTHVEEWELPDPAGQPLDRVRAIRDLIENKVKAMLDEHLEEIRSDPTAHQIRVARLLPSLIEEFSKTKSEREIRECADAVLKRYADAPVRSFMITMAERSARACLQEERCAPADELKKVGL